MEKGKVGDIIEWRFDEDYGSFLSGKTFQAEIAAVMEDGNYGVYTSYGQDIVPPNKCKIIKVK